MNRDRRERWLVLACRLLLGAVFIYAGAVKMPDPVAFADSIASFRMLPPGLVSFAALGLPPFEVLAGMLLVTGWKMRVGAAACLLLSVLFSVAFLQAFARGLVVDCGCFGAGPPSRLKNALSLGRDILLMAAAGWLYFTAVKKQVSDSSPS